MKRRRKSSKKDFRMVIVSDMLKNVIEQIKRCKFSKSWSIKDWSDAFEIYTRHFEELLSINKEIPNRIGFDSPPTQRDLQNIKVSFLNEIASQALNLTIDDLKKKYEVT